MKVQLNKHVISFLSQTGTLINYFTKAKSRYSVKYYAVSVCAQSSL